MVCATRVTLGHQRIDDFQVREAKEVAVGAPQRGHGVREADRRNSCIMNGGTNNHRSGANLMQSLEMIVALANQMRRIRTQPGVDGAKCLPER